MQGTGVATNNSCCEILVSIINEDQNCLNPWRWFSKMYMLGKVYMFPTLQPLCKKVMKDFYLLLIFFAIMFVLSYVLAWHNDYLI